MQTWTNPRPAEDCAEKIDDAEKDDVPVESASLFVGLLQHEQLADFSLDEEDHEEQESRDHSQEGAVGRHTPTERVDDPTSSQVLNEYRSGLFVSELFTAVRRS